MTMQCFVCGKKLNIFSDYTQIKIEGVKKEICTSCNRKKEKEKVMQLLKTEKGKKEVKSKGIVLLSTGVLEIGVGIFILNIMPLASIIVIGFGAYSVYKGIAYIMKPKK
jgi:hypothetical protein